MKLVWIGKAIMIIGAIHTAFGLVVFRSTLAELAGENFVNTVNGQPLREFAFWFIAFGLLGIIFGMLVDWCERKIVELPKFLGWGLLALTLAMLIVMPISGGWLLLPPAFGAILRARKLTDAEAEASMP